MSRRVVLPALPVWSVYRLTCKTSGKAYIGATRKPVANRFLAHRISSRHRVGCAALGAAIRKYGEDAWLLETLYIASSEAEMYAVEKGLIAAYGTLAPHGYNLSTGGDGWHSGIRNKSNRPRSQEHRDHLREAQLKHWSSPAVRERMRQSATLRQDNIALRQQMAEHAARTYADPAIRAKRVNGLRNYWSRVRSGDVLRTQRRSPLGVFC